MSKVSLKQLALIPITAPIVALLPFRVPIEPSGKMAGGGRRRKRNYQRHDGDAKTTTIWPEYCAADFFMGWHIYEREQVGEPGSDPIPNKGERYDWSRWGWLKDESRLRRAHALCVRLGHGDMPEPERYSDDFQNEFAQRFPRGIQVTIREYGEYYPVATEARADRGDKDDD